MLVELAGVSRREGELWRALARGGEGERDEPMSTRDGQACDTGAGVYVEGGTETRRGDVRGVEDEVEVLGEPG